MQARERRRSAITCVARPPSLRCASRPFARGRSSQFFRSRRSHSHVGHRSAHGTRVGWGVGLGIMLVSSTLTSEEPFVSSRFLARAFLPRVTFVLGWSSPNKPRAESSDRYLTYLSPADRAADPRERVGVWLPIDVCLAHYRACDARQIWGSARVGEIGVEVTRRVHGTSLALALRLAKQAGVTPWSILTQPRACGSASGAARAAIYKRGPKEAVLEVIQWPGLPAFRTRLPARSPRSSTASSSCSARRRT